MENTIIEHQKERKPKSRFYNIIFNGVIFLVIKSCSHRVYHPNTTVAEDKFSRWFLEFVREFDHDHRQCLREKKFI